MAFWDFLKRPVPSAYFTPNVNYLGGDELAAMATGDMTPAEMWRTQPHLRTVVSFLARNIAQLGIHSFERDGEDRLRDRTSPFARAMARPNPSQTAYELIYSLVGDLSLYDRAYWLVEFDGDRFGLRRLPPAWVSVKWKNAFEPESFLVMNPGGREPTEIPADQVLSFTGYSPTSMRHGSPTVEALKGTLQEQLEAAKYRQQVWKRGGRVSAVLQRPAGVEWTDEQAKRFREDWHANYTGSGKRAGGTPILEDGMTLNRIDFTAQEQQFVEASKLSFSTVASAFHVNPTMVGILDNANYSNVREFRRMLYGDTLGPLIAQIEGRINTFLLPLLGVDSSTHYAEFNIAEKLQGSFEEQAAVMQTLVGRPIMTGDEGRSKFNLPALGGDMALPVTPLNVLISNRDDAEDSEGQAMLDAADDLEKRVSAATALIRAGYDPAGALEAVGLDPIEHLGLLPITLQRPEDVASVDPDQPKSAGRIQVKARAPQSYVQKHEQVIAAFFERQGKAVRSALGAKAGDSWWNEERWVKELADDLLRLNLVTSKEAARQVLDAAGREVGEYDEDRTVAFLAAVAERTSRQMNDATKRALDAALESDDPSGEVAHVFEKASSSRAAQAALTTVTAASAFGATEAARQAGSDGATKTWLATSKNPRPSHSAMNGQTVGINEKFSNGADWPADGNLDVDEVAGCECEVLVEF